MEQIEMKVYLKHLKKPLTFVLSDKSQVQKFVTMLSVDSIIRFGDIIFAKDEFIYAECEEKHGTNRLH